MSNVCKQCKHDKCDFVGQITTEKTFKTEISTFYVCPSKFLPFNLSSVLLKLKLFMSNKSINQPKLTEKNS